MATAKLIETHRNGAEIYHGDIAKPKALKLLEDFSIPTCLMPLDEIVEFGFNRATGFFWLKTNKKKEQKFKKIGTTVIYNVEITAFLEKHHMSKLTGVKARELLVPVVICDLLVGEPSDDMVKFTTSVGLSRSNPVSAFKLEDGENGTK